MRFVICSYLSAILFCAQSVTASEVSPQDSLDNASDNSESVVNKERDESPKPAPEDEDNTDLDAGDSGGDAPDGPDSDVGKSAGAGSAVPPPAGDGSADDSLTGDGSADDSSTGDGSAGDSSAGGETVEPEASPQVKPVRAGRIFSEQERLHGMEQYMSEKRKKADEYFRRGVLLYEGEDYASAAEAFKIAYETLPHPAVLGNIAMCYDNAGKISEAVAYYRLYFDSPVSSDKNDTMTKRLEALRALVGDLQIKCEQECEIRVDGLFVGKSEAQAVVMPGRHRVEAVVDDVAVASELVFVNAREIKVLSLSLPESNLNVSPASLPALAPAPVSTDNYSARSLCPGFWLASGVSVVSLSLVTAFGTMTLNEKADYRASDWTDKNAKEQGEHYKITTNVMIGLAGTSAVAALLFAMTGSKRRRAEEGRITVEPVSSGGAGIAVSF